MYTLDDGRIIYGVIYIIRNKVNDKRYIGQTINQRGFDGRYRGGNWCKRTTNEYLKRSGEKYGVDNFEVIKVFDIAMNKDELDEKEKYWIDYYDTTNNKKGYNMTKGGGNSNTFLNKTEEEMEEIRKKISEANKGENNPMYGKHHSEKTKKKISEANSGENSSVWGKHRSEETKRKMSENHADFSGKNNPSATAVICLTTKKIFFTVTEGAEFYGMKGNSGICACCKGSYKSAGKLPDGTKLVWMHLKDWENIPDEEKENVRNKKQLEADLVNSGKNNYGATSVICLTTKRIFLTAKEGGEYYGYCDCNIVRCCKGYRMEKGKKIKVKSAGKLPDGTPLVWRYLVWKHDKKFRKIS